LKGPEATAATAKQLAEGYEELLLSCHGRFDTNSPENSEFRLHGADRLRVADVLALKLDQVRLVVASACETGLTDVHDPGDEYVGLPGAFLAAGARCAIASLWSVEQVATGLLIDRFHRELHEGGLPPTAALRAAQLWLRDVGLHEVLGLMKKRQDELASQRWGGAGAPEEAIARLVLTRASLSKLGPKPFCAPLYWAAFQLVGAGW
jgi:CHAT domain-containing protein